MEMCHLDGYLLGDEIAGYRSWGCRRVCPTEGREVTRRHAPASGRLEGRNNVMAPQHLTSADVGDVVEVELRDGALWCRAVCPWH